MEWLKVEKDTPLKPEIIGIAAGLVPPRSTDDVFGKCFRLWSWFDSQTQNGCARGATLSFVDEYVGCAGFAQQLLKVAWLAEKNGSLSIPHFDRHMGKSAKARALASERMKRSRGARSATKASPEKRREEKSIKKKKKSTKSAHLFAEGEDKAPTNGEHLESRAQAIPARALWGKPPIQFDPVAVLWVGITDAKARVWADAFPAVEIERELSAAAAWVVANGAKGRKSNYDKFLTSWLSRSQDRGGQGAARQDAILDSCNRFANKGT